MLVSLRSLYEADAPVVVTPPDPVPLITPGFAMPAGPGGTVAEFERGRFANEWYAAQRRKRDGRRRSPETDDRGASRQSDRGSRRDPGVAEAADRRDAARLRAAERTREAAERAVADLRQAEGERNRAAAELERVRLVRLVQVRAELEQALARQAIIDAELQAAIAAAAAFKDDEEAALLLLIS